MFCHLCSLFFQHWLHLGLQLLKNLENTQDKSHIVPPLPPMTCSQKEHNQLHHARQVWSLTLPRCNFGPSKMTTLANAFLSPHEHWMDAWEGQGATTSRSRSGKPESSWRCIISSAICTKPGTFATALIHVCVPYKRAGTRTDYYCQARGQRNTLKLPHTVRLLLGNKGRF